MCTKEEWQEIVDQEEGEQFIVSLIDEILQRSRDVIFEKHIESQVLPYALQFTKDTLIKVIEWEFFRRDPGEPDPEIWIPDEEPAPAVIDSWARGAIPIITSASPRIPYQQDPRTTQQALQSPNQQQDPLSLRSAKSSHLSAAPSAEAAASQVPTTPGGFGKAVEPRSARRSTLQKPTSTSTTSPSKKKSNKTTTSTNRVQASPETVSSKLAKTGADAGSPSRRPWSSSSSIRKHGNRMGAASGPTPAGQAHGSGVGADGTDSLVLNGSMSEWHAATSAMVMAEQAIKEENKRTLARIHNFEKDGPKTEYAYDHEGRIIVVKKMLPSKLLNQGVKAKVSTMPATDPSPPKPPTESPSRLSPVRRTHRVSPMPTTTDGFSAAAAAAEVEQAKPRETRAFGGADNNRRPQRSQQDKNTKIPSISSSPQKKTSDSDLRAKGQQQQQRRVGGAEKLGTTISPSKNRSSTGWNVRGGAGVSGVSEYGQSGGVGVSFNANRERDKDRDSDIVYVEDAALAAPSLLPLNFHQFIWLMQVDTMKLAPGVTLREGNVVKRGPPLPKRKDVPPFTITGEPTMPGTNTDPNILVGPPPYTLSRMTQPPSYHHASAPPFPSSSAAAASSSLMMLSAEAMLSEVLSKAKPVVKGIGGSGNRSGQGKATMSPQPALPVADGDFEPEF
ncbi:hypothetical protein HK102_000414 [Quaeritorhiza haematococci]|nr:hypothetical protein HK102_000414 [Quaeritorhiza haematococci]